MSQEIELVAVVREYKPNAMNERYEDGHVAVYDLSRLEVKEPERLAGRELRIFHDEPVPADSPWRAIGRAVAFHAVEAELTDEHATVFAGAVRDLRAR